MFYGVHMILRMIKRLLSNQVILLMEKLRVFCYARSFNAPIFITLRHEEVTWLNLSPLNSYRNLRQLIELKQPKLKLHT
jgi:hypothetical protein